MTARRELGRRSLVGAAAAGWLLAPLRAPAQPVGKMVRIGWLANSQNTSTTKTVMQAFSEGMQARGWIDGRDYTIDPLFAEGHPERLPALAAELVRRHVDLIVSAGSPATAAARAATNTIPIVFFFVGDPIGSGFVSNLAHPVGNVTGLGGLGPGVSAKQLELLRAMLPSAKRIAMLINPSMSVHAANQAEMEPAARAMNLVIRPVPLRSPDDIDEAFATIARERVHALFILGQPFLFAHGERVARLAIEQRLAACIPFDEGVRSGLLMSYGWKILDDARRLPHYVERILRGAKPSELPVEQPSRFYLTINLKTARAIGLTVPQSILLSADEVIE
ncbi:MAG: ABC transporter substrate-binding protein [Burkholderiaceae bacterium]